MGIADQVFLGNSESVNKTLYKFYCFKRIRALLSMLTIEFAHKSAAVGLTCASRVPETQVLLNVTTDFQNCCTRAGLIAVLKYETRVVIKV